MPTRRREAYLGLEQMAWFKDRLRAAQAPWKIWGHSFGTLTGRTDPQNLPAEFARPWPAGAGYGVTTGAYRLEHGEIFDMVRDEGITGLTIVAGDRHAFWAGYPSKTLPPRAFDPVGVEFVTGSISAQTWARCNAHHARTTARCGPSTSTTGRTARWNAAGT